MKFWPTLLLLFLFLPAVADEPVANIRVTAYAYYDEYEREWHQVDTICIRQIDDNCLCVEQVLGGVESAEAELAGLKMESQYVVRVTWLDGYSKEETYTVFETGNIDLWIDLPD